MCKIASPIATIINAVIDGTSQWLKRELEFELVQLSPHISDLKELYRIWPPPWATPIGALTIGVFALTKSFERYLKSPEV
jgi:hypothetical protein